MMTSSMPNNPRVATYISAALALTACVVWLVGTLVEPHDENINKIIGDEAVTSRLLRNNLDEDVNEEDPIPNLFPLQTFDYVGFACTIIGLILAAGAGIGGGGLLVPIFILIFDFPIKHAIPLASATVLGGAIANNLLNARKAHPDHPSRPAIDWDLIVQLEPMTIAGALIGAELYDLLPDAVLVLMLFLLLSITAYKTLQKAHKLYQQETEAKLLDEKQQDAAALLTSAKRYVEDGLTNQTEHSSYGSVDNGSDQIGSNDTSLSHQPSFGIAQVQQARRSAVELTLLFVVITTMNLLKGGAGEAGGGPMGLAYCGPTCFWVTEAAMLLIILAFSIFTRTKILTRLQSGGPTLSDIEWDQENTVIYPIYAIIAGLVAGLFGVGGGIIKGPLMLALGTYVIIQNVEE